MATTVCEPFMPTRCWIAPEIPMAKYIFGATVWPELPTCRSMGSQPASQIGREAASSAPRCKFQQIQQVRLVDRRFATAQFGDLGFVGIDARNAMPQVREARARDSPNVSGPDDSDSHGQVLYDPRSEIGR